MALVPGVPGDPVAALGAALAALHVRNDPAARDAVGCLASTHAALAQAQATYAAELAAATAAAVASDVLTARTLARSMSHWAVAVAASMRPLAQNWPWPADCSALASSSQSHGASALEPAASEPAASARHAPPLPPAAQRPPPPPPPPASRARKPAPAAPIPPVVSSAEAFSAPASSTSASGHTSPPGGVGPAPHRTAAVPKRHLFSRSHSGSTQPSGRNSDDVHGRSSSTSAAGSACNLNSPTEFNTSVDLTAHEMADRGSNQGQATDGTKEEGKEDSAVPKTRAAMTAFLRRGSSANAGMSARLSGLGIGERLGGVRARLRGGDKEEGKDEPLSKEVKDPDDSQPDVPDTTMQPAASHSEAVAQLEAASHPAGASALGNLRDAATGARAAVGGWAGKLLQRDGHANPSSVVSEDEVEPAQQTPELNESQRAALADVVTVDIHRSLSARRAAAEKRNLRPAPKPVAPKPQRLAPWATFDDEDDVPEESFDEPAVLVAGRGPRGVHASAHWTDFEARSSLDAPSPGLLGAGWRVAPSTDLARAPSTLESVNEYGESAFARLPTGFRPVSRLSDSSSLVITSSAPGLQLPPTSPGWRRHSLRLNEAEEGNVAVPLWALAAHPPGERGPSPSPWGLSRQWTISPSIHTQSPALWRDLSPAPVADGRQSLALDDRVGLLAHASVFPAPTPSPDPVLMLPQPGEEHVGRAAPGPANGEGLPPLPSQSGTTEQKTLFTRLAPSSRFGRSMTTKGTRLRDEE